MREQFREEGGARIATCGRGPDPVVETFVQIDGDILVRIEPAYLADPEIRRRHEERVGAWFEELREVVAALTAAVRTGLAAFLLLATGLALGAGGIGALLDQAVAGLVVGGISLAGAAGLNLGLRWLVRRALGLPSGGI